MSVSPSPPLNAAEEEQPVAGPSTAPILHLPKQPFASVEYPGSVTHAGSILRVCHQDDLNDCFNKPPGEQAELDMHYRHRGQEASDPIGAPVRGIRAPSQKLLVKIVKRRRRVPNSEDGEGIFTTEVLGPITQTVRFRYMADYHYTPPPDGRIAGIFGALKDLDYDSILSYQVPPLDETYLAAMVDEAGNPAEIPFKSLLDLQPPPFFSERRLPPHYNFKNAPQAVPEEVEDEYTGERRTRLVNKARFQGVAMPTLSHNHPPGDVPKAPSKAIKDRSGKLDKDILAKMKRLLEERPVWQRYGLLAQFTPEERHQITMSKGYIPCVGYSIGAGPFWKSIIRFGYDPCADPDAHIMYFYITVNRQRITMLRAAESESEDEAPVEAGADKKTHGWWEEEQVRRVEAGLREPLDKTREHLFDGITLHKDRPDYQLCDITDPFVRKIIDDPKNWGETCDPQSGWYTLAAWHLIREVMRKKYVHLRDTGRPAPDDICYDLITDYERRLRGEGTARSKSATAGPGGDGDDQAEGNGDIEMGE